MAKPKLTAVVIDALEDIKARDIRMINIAKLTTVSDYIVVATADSTRQTRALAHHVAEKVREAGYRIYGTEGEQAGEWVLVDCGDVVVHIMHPAVREYYKLEELWLDGKLEWPKPASAKKPAAKKVAAAKEPVRTARKTKAAQPAVKTAAGKKPATKKPAARKPAAKKSAAVAAKKPTARKKVSKTA